MGYQSWILLVFVLVGACLGYRRGLRASLIRMVSILGAYVLTLAYFMPLSRYIKSQWLDSWLLAYGLASILILFVGAGFISLLIKFALGLIKLIFIPAAQRHAKQADEPLTKSRFDAFAGAGLAGVFSAFFALIAIWSMTMLQQANPQLTQPVLKPIDQSLVSIAEKTMAASGQFAIDSLIDAPVKNQLVSVFLQNPVANLARIKRLSQSDTFAAFMADPEVRQAIQTQNSSDLAGLEKFQQLLRAPELVAIATEAGLLGAGQELDSLAAAEASIELMAKLEQLGSNAEAQELLAEPDFQKKLASGNFSALLFDARFNRLLELFNQPLAPLVSAPGRGSPKASLLSPATPVKSQFSKKIYRWRDKDGRLHFSDKDPTLKAP